MILTAAFVVVVRMKIILENIFGKKVLLQNDVSDSFVAITRSINLSLSMLCRLPCSKIRWMVNLAENFPDNPLYPRAIVSRVVIAYFYEYRRKSTFGGRYSFHRAGAK
jgi:hypothetical protein